MLDMFPTRVGMNRYNEKHNADYCYVPHTRGDEPSVEMVRG